MYYYWKGIAVEIALLIVNGFRYYVLGDDLEPTENKENSDTGAATTQTLPNIWWLRII